ncbi:unnamed protein product, partial [Meganyctiphanes norvegica]
MSDPKAESLSAEMGTDPVVNLLSEAWSQPGPPQLPTQHLDNDSQQGEKDNSESQMTEEDTESSVDLLSSSGTYSAESQSEGDILHQNKISSEKCENIQVTATEQETPEECADVKSNGTNSEPTNVSSNSGNDSMKLLHEEDEDDNKDIISADKVLIENGIDNIASIEEEQRKDLSLVTDDGIDPFSPKELSQSHCNGGDLTASGTDTTDSAVVVDEPSSSVDEVDGSAASTSSSPLKASSEPSSRRSSGRSSRDAEEESSRRGSRTLGDTKGVYRLSMKLSPNLFNMV